MDYIKLRNKYQSELEKLSPRTRRVLENGSMLAFDSFYKHVFTYQSVKDFHILRGSGIKCKKELEKLVKNVFSSGTDFKSCRKEFKAGIKRLSSSTIRTLNYDCILIFETFYDNFYVQKNKIDQRLARNCRPVIRKEVEQFVEAMSRSLEASCAPLKPYYLGSHLPAKSLPEISDEKNTSFAFLDLYLSQPGRLKPVELEIYLHYFCYVKGFKKEGLTEIAERNELTSERIRQRSLKLNDLIRKIVIYLTEGQSLNFQKYFIKNYFIINEESASVINQLENTKFSPGFIALVLSVSLTLNYDFIILCKKENPSVFLFVKKSVPVSFLKIYQYLDAAIKSINLRNNNFPIMDLFESFCKSQIDKKDEIIQDYNKADLMKILELIIESINHKNYFYVHDSVMLKVKMQLPESKLNPVKSKKTGGKP
jgi:hypothetical protein